MRGNEWFYDHCLEYDSLEHAILDGYSVIGIPSAVERGACNFSISKKYDSFTSGLGVPEKFNKRLKELYGE